jgi:hypothetical protein
VNKPIFCSAKANEYGQAIDQNGDTHKVIAVTNSFIITENPTGKESCFTLDGIEVGIYTLYTLISPTDKG